MTGDSLWQEAGELDRAGRAFCLVTVAETSGSVPRRAGAAMLVRDDGSTIGTIGGASIERTCAEVALEVIASGKPVLRKYSLNDVEGKETGSICGGSVTILFHPRPARRILHLFGAGHVARPTAHLAAMAGYSVIVYEEKEEYADRESFPDAMSIRVGDPVRSAEKATFSERDAVIIMTGSHKVDFEILKALKDRKVAYLGVIASRKKAVHMRKELKAAGWTEAAIDAVHAPIGLDIPARTPGEIAISIAAELITVRGPVE